jgi:hypothetical protein
MLEDASTVAPGQHPVPVRQPLTGPFAWDGRELERTQDWVRPLAPDEIAEIDQALRAVAARGLPLLDIAREDFPLPGLTAALAEVRRELEQGRGFVLLRGLPVERYTVEELSLVFWGLGTHLGTAVSQSRNGEFLGEVRDLGVRLGQPTSRGYRSKEHLRFHTDRCDVVGLLCARKARSGGLSRIVSSVAIHNEILKRRPDLLDLLYRDYCHSRQGEEAPGEAPYYVNPIFGVRDGRFTSQYSRSYIESAQRFPEVPRITAAQDEALDLLAALAEELCLHMDLEPGDIQLLNNHVTYHSRTGYEDFAEPERQRLLLRLWLSMPNSRALPPGYETLWGRIEAGAVRGGVTAAAGYRNILDYRRSR